MRGLEDEGGVIRSNKWYFFLHVPTLRVGSDKCTPLPLEQSPSCLEIYSGGPEMLRHPQNVTKSYIETSINSRLLQKIKVKFDVSSPIFRTYSGVI